MQQKKTDLFQTAVILYSFILTVLVIWIHAVDPEITVSGFLRLTGGAGPFLQELLGSCLGQIAVPGFFCLSAYLFFRNAGRTDADFYAAKWKKRIRTLLIPYLIWNLIYYLIYLAAGKAQPDPETFAEAVLFHRFHPVFWYLEELILLTLAAPLAGFLLKKKAAVLPVLLISYLAAVFYEWLPFHLINEDAVFYYLTGAAFALHQGGAESDLRVYRRMLPVFTAVYLICEIVAIFFPALPSNVLFFVIGARISGLLALFSAVMLYVSKKTPVLPEFVQYNFFIYAVHYLEIRFFQLGAGLVFGTPLPDGIFAVLYLIMPVLCIASSVFAAKLMKSRVPKLYAVLTGGRS